MIGEMNAETKVYSRFQWPNLDNVTNVSAESVEQKLREHLSRASLGTPYASTMSVKDVMDSVTAHQGAFIAGPQATAFDEAIEVVRTMADEIHTAAEAHLTVLRAAQDQHDRESFSKPVHALCTSTCTCTSAYAASAYAASAYANESALGRVSMTTTSESAASLGLGKDDDDLEFGVAFSMIDEVSCKETRAVAGGSILDGLCLLV